jgi:hypothetical protein
MPDQPVTSDDRKSARAARAQSYFDQDLNKQLDWYSDRASVYKSRNQLLSIFVIVAGVATTFVQIFSQEQQLPWVPVITAALGGAVALTEGWQRIARYSETWNGYRSASERMKREFRLYVNGAGDYRSLDEERDYLQFVENIEAIIAEEQQLYWQGQRGALAKDGQEAGQPQRDVHKQ